MKNSSKHLPQSPTYRRGRWVSPGRYPAIQSGLLSLPTSPSGRRSCCGCACPMTSHKRFPIGLNAPRSSLASDGGNETCRIRPEGRWHMTPSPRDPGGGLGRLGSAQQPALWVRILCRSRHRSPTSSSEQATARSKPTSRDWWKSFHDATLNQLTDIAYNQNLTLLSAGTRVLQARARRGPTGANCLCPPASRNRPPRACLPPTPGRPLGHRNGKRRSTPSSRALVYRLSNQPNSNSSSISKLQDRLVWHRPNPWCC